MGSKTNIVIGILIFLVIILGGIVAYTYIAKPLITGYVVNIQDDAQGQGAELAIITIAQQAVSNNCQLVPLNIGEQTINLIWYDCVDALLQQQAQLFEESIGNELEVNLEG